jgi:hypothetical protein
MWVIRTEIYGHRSTYLSNSVWEIVSEKKLAYMLGRTECSVLVDGNY